MTENRCHQPRFPSWIRMRWRPGLDLGPRCQLTALTQTPYVNFCERRRRKGRELDQVCGKTDALFRTLCERLSSCSWPVRDWSVHPAVPRSWVPCEVQPVVQWLVGVDRQWRCSADQGSRRSPGRSASVWQHSVHASVPASGEKRRK